MGTDRWGIDDGWWGNDGQWHDADRDTIAALRDLFGGEDGPVSGPPMWFVRQGDRSLVDDGCTLVLEDGTDLGGIGSLPDDLPLGIHLLTPADGGPVTRLACIADRVGELPAVGGSRRRWGVTVQVPTVRTASSWGVGDARDLATMGRWLASRGGTVLGLSPVGDAIPVPPRQNSPYSPSSRRFLDPLIIALDPIDDTEAGRAAELRGRPELDRDAVFEAKLAALERRWGGVPPADRPSPGFGTPAGTHALYCTLAEYHCGGWQSWPIEFQHPGSPAVAAFAGSSAERISFWRWVQERAESDLRSTVDTLRDLGVLLLGDLPVGVDPSGADAWVDQDQLAMGWSIGAPPDPIGPHGQDWGLPPYDPHQLRAVGYEPFLATLRANFARWDVLRIDHVMGLFRLFWIPQGADPAHGTYVRFHGHELVDLVVSEAVRAGRAVVGEDLGTVEENVRETLADRRIFGTKVAWFEHDAPEHWALASLGTLTTHDLPTVAGALSETDPTADRSMIDAMHSFAQRGYDDDHDDVAVAAHQRLGGASSELVLATLEDLVGSRLRVNLPGTVDQYPNWRLPLHTGVDELDDHPLAGRIADALGEHRR